MHLLTGAEVIGDIKLVTNEKIVISTPIRMVFVPEKGSMVFLPMFPFTEETDFEFNPALVLARYTPTTEIVNKYNTQFGTGLIVPEKQGLIIP